MPPTFVRPSGTPLKMPIAASAVGSPTICVLPAVRAARCAAPPVVRRRREVVDLRQIAAERRSRARRWRSGRVRRASPPCPSVALPPASAMPSCGAMKLEDVDRLLTGVLRQPRRIGRGRRPPGRRSCAACARAPTRRSMRASPAPTTIDFLIRSSSQEIRTRPVPRTDAPETPGIDVGRRRARLDRSGTRLVGDDDHADAHVERAEHLVARHLPGALELRGTGSAPPSSSRRRRRRACPAARGSGCPAARRR